MIRIILFACFVLFLGVSFGQDQKDDSLSILELTSDTAKVNAYLELESALESNQFQEKLDYLTSAREISEEQLAGNTPHQLFYQTSLAEIHKRIGRLFQTSGNYATSLDHCFKRLDIQKKLGDREEIAGTYLSIAGLYKSKKVPETCIDYSKKSLAIFTELNDDRGIAQCYNYIGIAYRLQEKMLKAIEQYQLALNRAERLNDTLLIVQTFQNIGIAYKSLKEYDKARESLLMAKELSERIKNDYNLANTFLTLAVIEYEQKNYHKAIQYSDEGIERLGSGKSLIRTLKLYKTKAKSLNRLGQYAEAFKILDKANKIKGKLDREDNSLNLARVEFNYLYESKRIADSIEHQKQLEINELKIKDQEAQTAKVTAQRTALIIGVLFISLIGLFIYRIYRQNRKDLAYKKRDLERLAIKIKRESKWVNALKTLNKNLDNNDSEEAQQQVDDLLREMKDDLLFDKKQQLLAQNVNIISDEFRAKLLNAHPDLVETEVELCELIRLNSSSVEIAQIRNISQESARKARYRLKKKLQLEKDDSIVDYLSNL